MENFVFLAVLFAALCHAGWNALIKVGLDPLFHLLYLAFARIGHVGNQKITVGHNLANGEPENPVRLNPGAQAGQPGRPNEGLFRT